MDSTWKHSSEIQDNVDIIAAGLADFSAANSNNGNLSFYPSVGLRSGECYGHLSIVQGPIGGS